MLKLKDGLVRALGLLPTRSDIPDQPSSAPVPAPVDPSPKVVLTRDKLDEFIAESDRLGGATSPEAVAYWSTLTYQPHFAVDQSLDPYSEAYVSQQVSLWAEITGRSFDQEVNEACDFPMDLHLAAANPYARRDASSLAEYLATLANVALVSGLPNAPKVLDMGCGWGLTAEVFAYLGASVTAVDINSPFVDLVNARAKRFGWPIQAHQAAFETFEPIEAFDLALFYRCVHHSVRPWEVIDRLVDFLEVDGKIVFACEPVQEIWWKHWGIRLDPFSIYCMRKFGWFESGFSESFLEDMAQRSGLALAKAEDATSGEPIFILKQDGKERVASQRISAMEISRNARNIGWGNDGSEILCASARSVLDISPYPSPSYIELDLDNYRGRPIDVTIQVDHRAPVRRVLGPGTTRLRMRCHQQVAFESEVWRPADELGSDDPRLLAFHLSRLSIARRL